MNTRTWLRVATIGLVGAVLAPGPLRAEQPPAAGLAPGAGRLALHVLYTSDLHGHIGREGATFLNPEFPPPLGGGASAAAYIGRVRTETDTAAARVLLFDCGDLFQGTPLGAHTQGLAIIDWMNRMRYDAATLGNHDFDRGREQTERLARSARFPILVSNLYERSSGRRVDWVLDHVVFDLAGVRVAVLGYITESTVEMAFAKNVAGLEFRPVMDVLPADVERVRAEGADLVFVLLHHGLPYVTEVEPAYRAMIEREAAGRLVHPGMDALEIAHAVHGVDVIFGGHTHQGVGRPWEDPRTHTLVFEPYANGSSIGHVTFTVDRGTRRIVGWQTHFDRGAMLTLLEDEVWPDTTEYRLIGGQVAEAESGLEEIVARTTEPVAGGTAESGLLGFVVADAYREELGADLALQNLGGVRGSFRAGPITERDLLQVSPFGNQLVIAKMPGALVRDLLEDRLRGRATGIYLSGGVVRYDPSRPEGSRLVSFTIGGAPLDTARVYRVGLTDYLAEGNSGLERLRALGPEDLEPSGFTDRDVLRRYLRRIGTLRPVNDGRWLRVSKPRP